MASETKEQKKKYDHEKTIELYDKWKAHEIERSEYLQYLCDVMMNFIKHRIKEKHRTLGAEYEDLLQEGYVAVCAMADTYNPHITKPATYYQQRIDEKTKDACRKADTKMTRYYLTKAYELERAARENGFEGLNDPLLTADTLSVLSGLPLTTVLEARKYAGYSTVSLEAASDNRDIESPFITPERAILEKEKLEFINEQLESLSPLEQYLIKETIMADKPKSLRKILEDLRTPEIKATYECELPKKVEQVFLQQVINHALRRIKRSVKSRQIVEMPEADIIDYVEQASEDDVESAIINNMLDL